MMVNLKSEYNADHSTLSGVDYGRWVCLWICHQFIMYSLRFFLLVVG
jgi:hypothetical protein